MLCKLKQGRREKTETYYLQFNMRTRKKEVYKFNLRAVKVIRIIFIANISEHIFLCPTYKKKKLEKDKKEYMRDGSVRYGECGGTNAWQSRRVFVYTSYAASLFSASFRQLEFLYPTVIVNCCLILTCYLYAS